MIIRAATVEDADALAAIYGHHVLHGFGTFEEEPPSPAEMETRRAAVADRGLPYLVAEDGGLVLGFAYAGPFRLRQAYRYTVEDSVYIAPDAVGRGVGRAVLSAVIDACAGLGIRQVVAVIGDSGNAASVGLHRALGFEDAGVGKSFGFKHGRWVDIVWMQKALNGGDQTAPDAPGISLSGR
ncbi:MAG: GNAT family N-acetyltransferase [Alphaproteobacteria bacterium]|nr:GNAT family N-acetyltransferase [Alphaproteobacteria bacterium]MBU1512767.1 GNAT family N-acetyltransferase [Alphaproteobacteria bacterium]MBU2096552.1 GNAT family N-acetyltransferase [Alphaproteobacteria bacterium]MBU2151920.1 GNAT family N-acetyltransferase [Alphaproteobacteria bacterium]MBU2306430.1 GNAT family N-acetyltransferase [Alphaproteobacteria bacterium]